LDENVGGDDAEVFLDPRTSPFRQLSRLRVHLATGMTFDFQHIMDDQTVGLCLEMDGRRPLEPSNGTRLSDLSDLPTGAIERLELHVDARWGERSIIEASFVIDGRPLLVVAAEVEPSWGGTSRLRWGDECLFVFVNPHEADLLPWDSRAFSVLDVSPGFADLGQLPR
jgi:hypothetical protein